MDPPAAFLSNRKNYRDKYFLDRLAFDAHIDIAIFNIEINK
jgi:hypothetical protein